MSMSKKDFIALADHIRIVNGDDPETFTEYAIDCLADFLQIQNPRFNRERWLSYIAGECGPNGGAIRNKEVN